MERAHGRRRSIHDRATWAYPSVIVVLIAHVGSQALELMTADGTMLLVPSAMDLLVISLALLVWRARQPA